MPDRPGDDGSGRLVAGLADPAGSRASAFSRQRRTLRQRREPRWPLRGAFLPAWALRALVSVATCRRSSEHIARPDTASASSAAATVRGG